MTACTIWMVLGLGWAANIPAALWWAHIVMLAPLDDEARLHELLGTTVIALVPFAQAGLVVVRLLRGRA